MSSTTNFVLLQCQNIGHQRQALVLQRDNNGMVPTGPSNRPTVVNIENPTSSGNSLFCNSRQSKRQATPTIFYNSRLQQDATSSYKDQHCVNWVQRQVCSTSTSDMPRLEFVQLHFITNCLQGYTGPQLIMDKGFINSNQL
jgi:hypothetical protein